MSDHLEADGHRGIIPAAARWVHYAALALGLLAGCSDRGVRPVDDEGAREALRATLEAWKGGTEIGSLKDRSPSIVAQDLDWESGASLKDFSLLGEGKSDSFNLRVPVELTIRAKDGKESKKQVRYMVGTSPSITVFREIF